MTASPSPLNYAAAPKARGLRRAAIWLLIGFVPIGAALVYRNWEDVKKYAGRAGELWDQRRCLVYSAPADQIVYTEDRDEAKRLLGLSGYFSPHDNGRPDDVFAAYAPPEYVKVHGKDAEHAVLFLHERRTPDGKRVLVLVSYECTLMVWPVCTFGTRELATLTTDPPPSQHGLAGCMDVRPDPRRRRLTFFAGHADDSDPSHFTIAYRAAGGAGTVDGYVRDDGTVTMSVRDGPAAGAWDAAGKPKWERKPLE
ncbi:MAG TPA: hypothetical protein VG326_16325 [Tepidisphaeraceae bacterium]|jgi:hypothetical protein|nr:hypothetical protein [Tepidisphaeraceae bacterium]